MTTEIQIHAGKHNYPVVVGSGVLQEAGERLKTLGVSVTDEIFIVTDKTVEQLGYLEDVAGSAEKAGYSVHHTVVPAGDSSKSLSMVETLYNRLLDNGVRRNGVILALGGGVVGDLAGFVAATYQRGIRFVQMPTTLLAHDSSIGGKVGVNLPRGKNLVGAFYPPAAVLYDTKALASLPLREWQGGMAEVIKHAVIGNPQLFRELEQQPMVHIPGGEALEKMLCQAIEVKKSVIEADEKEQYLRMVLNLGHTIGHAVEQYSRYELSHGQAVSIGMAAEGRIAVHRKLLNEDDWRRIGNILAVHGLPIQLPDYPLSEIVKILNLDKKHNTSSAWTFVLPEAIGKVSIHRDVTEPEVERIFNER